jgi:hypothetical protein
VPGRFAKVNETIYYGGEYNSPTEWPYRPGQMENGFGHEYKWVFASAAELSHIFEVKSE